MPLINPHKSLYSLALSDCSRSPACGVARWLVLLAAAGLASTASAQQFFDFETGLENWAVTSFTNFPTTVAQSTVTSTTGLGSMAVSQTGAGFNWAVQVDSSFGDNFLPAIQAAVQDDPAAHNLEFDIIYRGANIPGAGTAGAPTFLNASVAMNSTTGGFQTINSVGLIGQAELQALTGEQVVTVSVPLSTFSLDPASSFYQITIGVNGDWGTGAATIYYDNFRVDPPPAIPTLGWDFTTALDGWEAPFGAGTVTLAPDIPEAGEQSMKITAPFGDFLRAAQGTRNLADGHGYYIALVAAVNDDPSAYTLELDWILRPEDMPSSTSFLSLSLSMNSDPAAGGMFNEVFNVATVVPAAITSNRVLRVSVPLSDFIWAGVNDPWEPEWVQLGIAANTDPNSSSYAFYIDNISVVPDAVVPPAMPPAVVDLDVLAGGANALVMWESTTGETYAISEATDLVASNWVSVATNLLATPPVNTYTQLVPSAASAAYRVEVTSGGGTPPDGDLLFSFEPDLEGWQPVSFNTQPVSVTTSTVVATEGASSMAVTQTGQGFSWTVQRVGSNDTFHAAISDVVSNQPGAILTYDVIYNAADIPGSPSFINTSVSMNSEAPGGWAQVNNLASIGQAELQNLTSNRVYQVNVPFASFSLSPTSTYYELNFAINGDWGSGDVTVYFDNIRVTSGP